MSLLLIFSSGVEEIVVIYDDQIQLNGSTTQVVTLYGSYSLEVDLLGDLAYDEY